MIFSVIGFIALAMAIAVLVVLGDRAPQRFAPAGELLDRVMASRPARLAIIVFWWWLGWHFLVAQTVDP